MMSNVSSALYVLQAVNSSTSAVDSIVSIINGQFAATSSADPVSALVSAEKNGTQAISRQKNDPETKNAVNHFLAVVAKAPDLKTLLRDPIARDVLLTANGLGDQTNYTALVTKALSSDTTKTGNFASTLSDTRWLAVANTYDFANKGLSKLKSAAVLSTVTSGYAEVKWRQSLDTTTPGLSAALDFRSRASTIKTVDQILGDTNIRKVVTTALGLPLEIAYQPLEAQEKAISSRIDISKFSNAAYVEQFTRRFLIANQSSSSSSNTYA